MVHRSNPQLLVVLLQVPFEVTQAISERSRVSLPNKGGESTTLDGELLPRNRPWSTGLDGEFSPRNQPIVVHRSNLYSSRKASSPTKAAREPAADCVGAWLGTEQPAMAAAGTDKKVTDEAQENAASREIEIVTSATLTKLGIPASQQKFAVSGRPNGHLDIGTVILQNGETTSALGTLEAGTSTGFMPGPRTPKH